MLYNTLGDTDLRVSRICLGTMTWGEQNTESEAHQQLDFAIESGINFVDCAEMYPVPPRAETYGRTESYIGSWLNKRSRRNKIILATKVTGRSDSFPYMRGGTVCLDRKNITTALDASLKRLQTDYIDLYQLHWPDRNTNYFGKLGFEYDADDNPIDIQETLEVVYEILKSGKVRHFGLSNETPWGTMTFIKLAEQHNFPKPVSIQNPYNLLNRTFEIGLSEISHQEHIGLLAYSPLGFGVLSGKYLHNANPPGARLTLFNRFTRYSNPQARRATEAYVKLAQDYEIDPAQMALAYVNTRSFLTANIIGTTNMEQLKANIESINLTLSDEIIGKIEAIHQSTPNPSP